MESEKCRKCGVLLPDAAIFCHMCGIRQVPIRNKGRRANGTGTAYRRGPGWCCEKTFGYDETGKRIFASKSGFKTKKEALEYIPRLTDPRSRRKGLRRSPDITLKELYNLWLPTHQALKSTITCYTSSFKVFAPVWHLPMKEMDIDMLQECLDSFTPKKGTSGKRTRQNAKACLGLVYKYGIPRGYVPPNLAGEANLAKFLKVRGGETAAKVGFSAEELQLIRDAVGIVPYADYIYCACYLGFRPSAFLALDVSRYDRIEKAIVGGIKTKAGKDRTVTISPRIQSIIDCLVKDKTSGPLFCAPDGSMMALEDYHKQFYVALESIGIENPKDQYGCHRLTPHSCRHTFATLLKNVSAPNKDKLELIGHTSEEMLRYYQDVSLHDLRRITDVI